MAISFEAIDYSTDDFVRFYDELPLWSAPFGMLALEELPIRAGARILDAGAGTGFLTIELAQRCGPASRVVAVDPWGAALRRLEAKLAHYGLRNVTCIEGPIEGVDLPAAGFDLVVSNLGVNNFADREASLRACVRAMTPDGRLALCTNTRGHMQEFYDVFRQTLAAVGLGECLPALQRHIEHRATRQSLEALLEAAGLRVARTVHDRSFTMRFANGSALLTHYFIRLAFLQEWSTICPAARRGDVFGDLEARLNAMAAARNGLSLSIPMLYVEAIRR